MLSSPAPVLGHRLSFYECNNRMCNALSERKRLFSLSAFNAPMIAQPRLFNVLMAFLFLS